MTGVPGKATWLYLAVLVGLYYLLRWYRERQVVSHLRDKYVFITGCDSGFGNLLARQLDLRGLRVLAACLTEKGAEQLRGRTSDRLETVILDVTKTESIAAATQWVKERTEDRGTTQISQVCFFPLSEGRPLHCHLGKIPDVFSRTRSHTSCLYVTQLTSLFSPLSTTCTS
ncbi:17-beta-hydroxysteroid dehydrogenase type 6-like [Diceros bicornis minor]|uniref:17-beta-hydroxysteroid dehydrogenase type 6-like n=1 Tax=Diceros bicornis minor TaxID=77932 RepID=UPI0026EA0776|nr:17-beta-hydroxysteroid dehydrogenase type 6-like [Diceros bicornis minor]